MRASLFLMAAAAMVVNAQNLTGEPDCAVPCLQDAIKKSNCDVNDQGCQCSDAGKAEVYSHLALSLSFISFENPPLTEFRFKH